MDFVSKTVSLTVNLIAVLSTALCLAQTATNNPILTKLDSIAFHSLETNSNRTSQDALNLLNESLKHPPSIYRVNAYTILGIVNKEKGYYVTSLNYYLDALNEAETIKDQSRISACLNNIGSVYQLQQNYEKAKSYFLKSLLIEDKLNLPLQKSIRYYNLGEVYLNLDNLDLAISYFNQSLMIEKKQNNDEGIIYALLGLSSTYIKIDRIVDAEFSLATVNSKLGPYNLEERILYNKLLGDLNSKTSNFKQALNYYYEAERISIKSNFRIYLLEIYRSEMKTLKALKRYEEFSQKAELYVQTQEELNNIKIKNQLEDLTFQNSIKQKELEIALIKEERELANKNADTYQYISSFENKIIWFLVGTILIVLIVVTLGVKQMLGRK